MIKEFLKSKGPVLVLLFCLIFSPGCTSPDQAYAERVAACLENAGTISFNMDGSEKEWITHKVDPDCLIGAQLPDFTAIDLEGNRLSTRSIKGKVNIINFWFTDCSPCVAEIPCLNTLVRKYHRRDVNFIAISRDRPGRLHHFLDEHPFFFSIIHNGQQIADEQFQLLWGYPFTIVTDRENRIVATMRSEEDPEILVKKIELVVDEQLSYMACDVRSMGVVAFVHSCLFCLFMRFRSWKLCLYFLRKNHPFI